MKDEDMCKVFFDDKGNQSIETPNGEVIKYVIKTDVEQDVDHAHSGLAMVTVKMWCKTK